METRGEWVGSLGDFDTAEDLLEITATLRPGGLRLHTSLGAADRRAGAGLKLEPLGVSAPAPSSWPRGWT